MIVQAENLFARVKKSYIREVTLSPRYYPPPNFKIRYRVTRLAFNYNALLINEVIKPWGINNKFTAYTR